MRRHIDIEISLLYFCVTVGPRFVRNEDVLDLDTSFEQLDVCVMIVIQSDQ